MSSKRKHPKFSAGTINDSVCNFVSEQSTTYDNTPAKWKRVISYKVDDTPDPDDDSESIFDGRSLSTSIFKQKPSVVTSFSSMLKEVVVDENGPENRPAKRVKYNPKDRFLEERDGLLKKLLQNEAPPCTGEKCVDCQKEGAYLKCKDCFEVGTRCQACILKFHRCHPTHRIKFFNGDFWQQTTLRDLGLVIQLGHDGDICAGCKAKEDAVTLVALDCTGIHKITVLFCQCGKVVGEEATELSQLVRNGWYPATKDSPRTIASFSLLDQYNSIACEAKISGYHFYKSLVRMTDIIRGASSSFPKRYEEFLRMAREYQHLKSIQRAGRVFESMSGEAIPKRGLAIECPACPHPGRNLPNDWENRTDSWIYTLYIMLDANFRMKRRSKKITKDVAMGDGLQYFVESKEYQEHLKTIVEEKDIRYCDSKLRAVDHASLKKGKGYDVSGIFAIQCRHMLLLPSAVGDLQYGERQSNVDFILLKALQNRKLKRLVISYDISCQYCIKFAHRMSLFPEQMQIDMDKVEVEFVIPQFHIAGHCENCRARYSLSYREHMGRTDGENIERGWATFNALSMATREMGSGARLDTLEYQFGDFNFQRVLSFGRLFSKRLKEAAGESIKHAYALQELRLAFPSGMTKQIDIMIAKWNIDPKNSLNPYGESGKNTTMADVRNWLLESEKYDDAASEISPESISATHWLCVGIELEDSRYNIKKSFKGLKQDRLEIFNTSAMERNMTAVKQIRAWKNKQIIHMPALLESDTWEPEIGDEDAFLDCWDYDLQFPSSFNAIDRKRLCSSKLVEKERRLRIAAANDSLTDIRSSLQLQWWLTKKKRKHVSGPGQSRNIKSSTAIESVVKERDKHVERYRRNRAAVVQLSPDAEESRNLKKLDDSDIRPLEDDEGKGEGRRVVSWIWTVKGVVLETNVKDVYEGMRFEYAKSRARALRWHEEVQLVKEEMRRVLEFFNWKIEWWMGRAQQLALQTDKSKPILGCIAYANHQASVLKELGMQFRKTWVDECSLTTLPSVIQAQFISTLGELKVKLPEFLWTGLP